MIIPLGLLDKFNSTWHRPLNERATINDGVSSRIADSRRTHAHTRGRAQGGANGEENKQILNFIKIARVKRYHSFLSKN